MGWKLAKIVQNNEYRVNNVNIFNLDWKKDGETIELKDVAHCMNRKFDVCSVDVNGNEFRFAVCEIAKGVYNFYVPDGK